MSAPIVLDGARVVQDGPPGALKLRELARESGWSAELTAAQAIVPPPRAGKDWRRHDSVAVRMQREGARAYAVWVNGRFHGAGALDGTGFQPQMNSGQISAYVAAYGGA